VEKSSKNSLATTVMYKKLPKVNNRPTGENSPNLATLADGMTVNQCDRIWRIFAIKLFFACAIFLNYKSDTTIFGYYFSKTRLALIFLNIGLAKFWGNFFTMTSGHPALCPHFKKICQSYVVNFYNHVECK
jgi:predicted MFS family arabinose efflux permease